MNTLRCLRAVFCTLLLLGPALTVAAPEEGASGVTGFELALRGAVALPLGDAQSGTSLKDRVRSLVPLQLDVGARFSPRVFLGGFFQYALGDAHGCPGCTLTDLRAGAELQIHFSPSPAVDPWVGLGGGYEWLHTDSPMVGSGGTAITGYQELSGFEFAEAQAGLNLQATPSFGLGPYVGISLGRFRRMSGAFVASGLTVNGSSEIEHPSLHGWFSAGLRAVFDIH